MALTFNELIGSLSHHEYRLEKDKNLLYYDIQEKTMTSSLRVKSMFCANSFVTDRNEKV